MYPPYLLGKCSLSMWFCNDAIFVPWKKILDLIFSLRNGLNILKIISNAQLWLTMCIESVRIGIQVCWFNVRYENELSTKSILILTTIKHIILLATDGVMSSPWLMVNPSKSNMPTPPRTCVKKRHRHLQYKVNIQAVTCALGSNDPISNKMRVAFNKSFIGIFDGFQLPIR